MGIGPAIADTLGSVASSAFNVWQADMSRDFQRDMANTSMQRRVKDLRAAGLNPMLAIQQGGAAVPPGATAQAAPFNSARTYLEAKRNEADIGYIAAQTHSAESDAKLKDTQSWLMNFKSYGELALLRAQARQALESAEAQGSQDFKNRHEVDRIKKEIEVMDTQMDLIRSQTAHSAYDLQRARNESEFERTWGGKVKPWLRMTMPAASSAAGAASSLKFLIK